MGSQVSKRLVDKFNLGKGKESKILMLGLDSAGKTTILCKLKGCRDVTSTAPTVGFNVETVSPVRNVSFTVWDVAGQDKLRTLWRHHYQNCSGLIFVIDSSDIARIDLAKSEFYKIITDDEMIGVPVLILANKQDLQTAMTPELIQQRLEMTRLDQRSWSVNPICAYTGDGLKESMEIFAKMVRKFDQESSGKN